MEAEEQSLEILLLLEFSPAANEIPRMDQSGIKQL
jgi:hypothetical protein